MGWAWAGDTLGDADTGTLRLVGVLVLAAPTGCCPTSARWPSHHRKPPLATSPAAMTAATAGRRLPRDRPGPSPAPAGDLTSRELGASWVRGACCGTAPGIGADGPSGSRIGRIRLWWVWREASASSAEPRTSGTAPTDIGTAGPGPAASAAGATAARGGGGG